MKNREIRDSLSELDGCLEVTSLMDGWQLIFMFENNYGASIINHRGSYGVELAVIHFFDGNWDITYDTDITNDVVGWLDFEECKELLGKIKLIK